MRNTFWYIHWPQERQNTWLFKFNLSYRQRRITKPPTTGRPPSSDSPDRTPINWPQNADHQSFDHINLIQDGSGIDMLELTPKTFWLLVLTHLPHCCDISRPYLVPVLIIELEPRTPFKKSGFSGQILIKLRLW